MSTKNSQSNAKHHLPKGEKTNLPVHDEFELVRATLSYQCQPQDGAKSLLPSHKPELPKTQYS